MIKKIIIKILIVNLIVISALLFFAYLSPIVIKKGLGRMFTKEIIDKQFETVLKKDFDGVFLGNSRVYRGINPEIITSLSTYNFGHDNDSYIQFYFKLKYLLDNNKKVNYCFIGVDYATMGVFSDTRNYVYNDKFVQEYQDYFNNKIDVKKEINRLYETYVRLRFSRFVAAVKNIVLNRKPQIEFLFTEDGQNKDFHIYTGKYKKNESDLKTHDVNSYFLGELVKLCKSNGIEIFFIYMPNSPEELSHRSKHEMLNYMYRYDSLANDEGISKIDLSYKFNDNLFYSDFVHLKSKYADSLSLLIDQKIELD